MDRFEKRLAMSMGGMDMSGMNMAGKALPNNPSLIWAKYFCELFLAVIVLLIARRATMVNIKSTFPKSLSLAFRVYTRVDRLVANKLSYRVPIGSVFLPSLGMAFCLLSYLAIVLVLLIYNSNLLVNADRPGFLALVTVPFSFAFAGKNSALTLVTGISHDKLNVFHRLVGRTMFVLVTVHMTCQITVWSKFTWFLNLQLQDPKVQYGLAAYSVAGAIFLTSLWPVRRYMHRVFAVSHSLFLVLLVLIAMHTSYAMRFTVTGIMLYILDQLAGWTIKTHMARAKLLILEDGCTKIVIAADLARKPGQHVYLWAPSVSMLEWHPFTISNVSDVTVTLHAQAVGKFTKALNGLPHGTELNVAIAGPYGEPPSLDGARSIVLVAGGSGASFTLPILLNLARRANTDFERMITFVWCVRRSSQLTWFARELETALALTENTNTHLSIQIHLSSSLGSESSDWGIATKLPLFLETDTRASLVHERMQYHLILDDVIQASELPHQIIHVVACGPDRLLHDVGNTVARQTSVRGNPIVLFRESFGC